MKFVLFWAKLASMVKNPKINLLKQFWILMKMKLLDMRLFQLIRVFLVTKNFCQKFFLTLIKLLEKVLLLLLI